MHTEFLIKLNDNKIAGVNKFHWNCYGKNAYYMDLLQENNEGQYRDFSIIYDVATNKVFQASFYLGKPKEELAFIWYDPEYRQAYFDECFLRSEDPHQATEFLNWMELSQTDFVTHIREVLNYNYLSAPKAIRRTTKTTSSTLDEEWNKEEIILNLTREEIESMKVIAMENEMTMNELVTSILEVKLSESNS